MVKEKFDCARFAPHNGPLMLDNVTVENYRTCLYFTEDAGTVIQAEPLGGSK